MRRIAAILGSGVFLVIAPGTLAVYVPWTNRFTVAPIRKVEHCGSLLNSTQATT